jgi:hypothetical protein
MFEQMRLRCIRKSQIANLQAYIESVYESELREAKTAQQRCDANRIAGLICEFERKELALLREEEQFRRTKGMRLKLRQISRQNRSLFQKIQ